MLRRTRKVERFFLKLVAHASPLVLEAELLDRVAAAKAADALSPVLIVVPSRRLADHVTHRLVERFGAILGVSVLHHRALAERVLEQAGVAPPRILGDALVATLFTRIVNRAAPGPLRDFVRDHPGAASTMLKALTDLREAGIEPAAAIETLSGPEAETAALYARWCAAWDEVEAAGEATDDAGLVRAAIAHAEAFAGRFSAIVHHGAYDLIGVRVELVRALDRRCELTFLVPADPVDVSGAFGVNRAHAIAPSRTELRRLGVDHAPVPVSFLHAQGARAELQTAAYEALAAVASGTPPREIAIVVRGFGPYLAAMDALLDAGGPPWHTSYTRPLRRDAGVTRGLRAIAGASDQGPLRWSAHAESFEASAREADAARPLGPLFEAMRDLETLLGETRAVQRSEALSWLEARVDAATNRPEGADGGGIRILDAMQARGLTFSQVGIIGMNAGIFPYVARESPFLSDAARTRLRELTGRPLPVASERDGEERLLLAMLLGSTRDRLRVSWRRADDSARPVVPSLALREVCRFAGAGSDVDDAERAARAIPAHPRARLEAWAASPGILDRRDEMLLAALASEDGAAAGPAVLERRPEWSDGIGLVAATEPFDPPPGPYDGRIGVSGLKASIGATALTRLGLCPLQFFFRDMLRIQALHRLPTPFASDPAEVGSRVHDVLREVYARLRDEGAFEGPDVRSRVARARALLREAWESRADEAAASRAARFPLLDRIETGTWMRTLDAFVEADLERLAEAALTPEALEHDVEAEIAGGPTGVVVRARFDRVLRGEAGPVVGDYKTGGRLEAKVKLGAMLTGEALQVPIYALMSGAPVELLGVGPRHDVEVAQFDGFKSPEDRDGVLETLRVAAALAQAGRFPIHPGDHCGWCDYRSACRHAHPPTISREARSADAADARDCWKKTAKTPSIEKVRRESK